jgi:hypothetical protein
MSQGSNTSLADQTALGVNQNNFEGMEDHSDMEQDLERRDKGMDVDEDEQLQVLASRIYSWSVSLVLDSNLHSHLYC